MNNLNTNPFAAAPYFKKEKLTQEQEALQSRIDDETLCLKKMTSTSSFQLRNSLKKPIIFQFFESSITLYLNYLYKLRAEYDFKLRQLSETRIKLYNFILPSEKSQIVEVMEERALQKEILKTKKFSIENHQTFMEGTKAELDFTNSQIISLEAKAELTKAQHHSTAVDNAGLDLELFSNYKANLLTKSAQELKDGQKVRVNPNLPTYPEQQKTDVPVFNFVPQFTKQEEKETPKVEHSLPQPKTEELRFTEVGSAPEYYVLENQNYECQRAFGVNWASDNFPIGKPEEEIFLSEKAKEELDAPNVSETFLGTITRRTVNVTFVIVFLAMIPEYLIYCKIISALFEYDNSWKQALCGTSVFLFSKLNAYILYNSVLSFLKKKSSVFDWKKIKGNRLYVGLLILSLIYCFCIGILYKSFKDDQNDVQKFTLLQQTSYEIREQGTLEENPNPEEIKKLLRENEKDTEKFKTKVFSDDKGNGILIYITIGLTGLITILFCSYLYAIAMIIKTSYKLRTKIDTITKRLSAIEGQFDAQKSMISTFREKAFKIFCLHGQLEFLRRISEATPRDVMFDPNKKEQEIKTPLPLNGVQLHQ